MKKWDALFVDKFTFDEMTMVVSLNLCFLLMILQESLNPFEFKTWFQFWESQPGSEPAKQRARKQNREPRARGLALKKGLIIYV